MPIRLVHMHVDHFDTTAAARRTTNDKHMCGSREEMTKQVGSKVHISKAASVYWSPRASKDGDG